MPAPIVPPVTAGIGTNASPINATWTFQQLGGSPPKKLELSGYTAPFGRPRKGPLFKEIIKSRVQTTRYPGSSRPPTRHTFGTHWEAMELSGRWMTKTMVQAGQTANTQADDWTDFVRDEQTVRMSWGSIFSYTVFIEELELSRESENEIAWRMRVLVDQKDGASQTKFFQPTGPATSQVDANINAFLANYGQLVSAANDAMPFDLFDQLGALAGELNQYQAQFNKWADQLSAIETNTFALLSSFRGAIEGFKRVLLQMRDIVLNTDIDGEVAVRSTINDYNWIAYQTNFDDQGMHLLGALGEMDRWAAQQQSASGGAFVEVQDGDTWETISTRVFGTPSRAADIRALNGIQYGQPPLPGDIYLVPSS